MYSSIDKIDNRSVSEILTDLLGRECTATKVETPSKPEDGMKVRATFNDDGDGLLAVAACDMRFAAFSGAAIAMLPVGGAKDAVDEGELSDMLLQAFNGVLEVLSCFFNTPGRKHCRYVGCKQGTLPDLAGEPTDTSRFKVDITGYGSGLITFISL